MSASLGEQVKGFEEAARPRLRPWLQLDPLLLIATLGLIGFGSYVIGTATSGDIAGNPHYYLTRQIAYGAVGVLQPDLGSGMVSIAIACSILFIAGTRWTHFLAIGTITATIVVGVLVGAPAAGVHLLKPYQVDRLTAFINPTDNPRKQGYQLK